MTFARLVNDDDAPAKKFEALRLRVREMCPELSDGQVTYACNKITNGMRRTDVYEVWLDRKPFSDGRHGYFKYYEVEVGDVIIFVRLTWIKMIHDKPIATPGLKSYRYPSRSGFIMIGAKDRLDALNEASRSLEGGRAVMDLLEEWDHEQKRYMPARTS